MVSSIDEHIGGRLRAKREEWGLSIEDLATSIGATPFTLVAYEQGRLRIGAAMLMSLSSLFNIKPRYFFENFGDSVARTCLQMRNEDNVIAFRPRRNS